MKKIDLNSLTLDEAKQYFLAHRDDTDAFYTYMDKLHASGRAIVIVPTDPNSEAKAQAAIQQKLDRSPKRIDERSRFGQVPFTASHKSRQLPHQQADMAVFERLGNP